MNVNLDTQHTLDIVAGTTYTREIFMYVPDYAKGIGETYGNSTWGAEFIVTPVGNPNVVIAAATTQNNQLTWAEDGLIVLAFPDLQTKNFPIGQADVYFNVVVADTTVDPRGTKLPIFKRTINISQAASVL